MILPIGLESLSIKAISSIQFNQIAYVRPRKESIRVTQEMLDNIAQLTKMTIILLPYEKED